MDMSLFLLSSRGRIDRAALTEIVKRSNERRRRIFTKIAELGFSILMFFFGGLDLSVTTAAGVKLDPTTDKVSPEDKMNAILDALKTTTKGTLFREFMRPFLITAAELLASMLEPDEMMMNIFAGADPLTGAPQIQAAPVYQAPQQLPGQVYVPPPGQAAPQAPPSPYEGQLLRGDGDQKVYHVAGGKKHWIVTEAVLKQRGYSWNQVRVMPLSVVMSIPDGPPET